MSRFQRILTGLLLLQVLILVFVFLPRGSETVAGGTLFAGLNSAEITQILLEDNAGESTTLLREGDGWVLADSEGFSADASKITPILDKISNLNTNRLITNTSSSHGRLQVADDDFLRRVTLTTEDDTYILYVGSSPSPGSTHVRNSDDDATFLTSDITQFEVNAAASGWIDTSYITLTRTDVSNLVVTNANGTYTFATDAEGAWQLAGLQADQIFEQTQFNTILGRIVSMRMQTPLGTTEKPEYGLDNPQARVIVTLTAGEEATQTTYTLDIGSADADGNTIVKFSDSPYYVTVAEFSVEPIINATRDDFAQTPTPEPVEEAPVEGDGG